MMNIYDKLPERIDNLIVITPTGTSAVKILDDGETESIYALNALTATDQNTLIALEDAAGDAEYDNHADTINMFLKCLWDYSICLPVPTMKDVSHVLERREPYDRLYEHEILYIMQSLVINQMFDSLEPIHLHKLEFSCMDLLNYYVSLLGELDIPETYNKQMEQISALHKSAQASGGSPGSHLDLLTVLDEVRGILYVESWLIGNIDDDCGNAIVTDLLAYMCSNRMDGAPSVAT